MKAKNLPQKSSLTLFPLCRSLALVLVGVGFWLLAAAQQAVGRPPPLAVDDLSADFSLAANPNGPWSYGYLTALDGTFGLLPTPRTFYSDNGVSIEIWELSTYRLPAVARVLGPGTAISDGGRFTALAGTVFFAPGADGAPENFGVIRFTVPAGGSGRYRIEVAVRSQFDGARLRDADFHVVKNGVELFGQHLAPNSGTGYTNEVELVAGDRIDFAVGRGPDGLTLDTGLKIQARLTQLPTPANNAPIAQSRSVIVNANTAVPITLVATDPDGDPLTYRVSAPVHGALTGSAPDLIYTPATNYCGLDSFTFMASDGKTNSNVAQVQILVLGARDSLEQVLNELVALQAGITNRQINEKLSEAVEHLSAGLVSSLWVDPMHLVAKKGDRIFAEAKETVRRFQELLDLKQSAIRDGVLRGFIDQIVGATRLLALVSVHEAAQAGLKPNKLAEDLRELAKGDEEATAGRFAKAIDHYRHAWKHAVHLRIKPAVHLARGTAHVEFVGIEGQTSVIQASTNLTDWVTIGTCQADQQGQVRFADPDAGRYPIRFYRVVEQ